MIHIETTIIRRIQRGERELFGELHDRYYVRVRRYVEVAVFQREEAQSLALDAFVRAYESLDRFRPQGEGSFLSYLLRIASNLVTDYRRRLPRAESVPLEELDNDPPLTLLPPTPEEELLQQEQVAQVQRALAELNVDDRQIIHLAYEEDLTRQQIAEVMGKPSVTSVTSHLYRALQKVRDTLAEEEEEIEPTAAVQGGQR